MVHMGYMRIKPFLCANVIGVICFLFIIWIGRNVAVVAGASKTTNPYVITSPPRPLASEIVAFTSTKGLPRNTCNRCVDGRTITRSIQRRAPFRDTYRSNTSPFASIGARDVAAATNSRVFQLSSPSWALAAATASVDDNENSAKIATLPSAAPKQSDDNDAMTLTYDLVVIGAGSAGLTAAKFATTFGKTSVLIEQSKLGGDCTHTGCVPSKTLLSCAKVAKKVSNAESYGILVHGSSSGRSQSKHGMKIDMKAIHDKIQATIRKIYDEEDSAKVLASKGVDTIQGRASFISNTTLSVQLGPSDFDMYTTIAAESEQLEQDISKQKETGSPAKVVVKAKQGIVLCTGATATIPPIEGLKNSDIDWATYETIFDKLGNMPQNAPPSRLTVVGGGPIGCELAQAFSRLGSKVTMIVPSLLLNDSVEPEAREALEKIFTEQDNITIVRGRLESVKQSSRNIQTRKADKKESPHLATVRLKKEQESKSENETVQIEGDLLLIATGRKPNTKFLFDEGGLKELGVELNKKTNGFAVDDNLCTTVPKIFAAGDCTGDKQFTHYAGYQGAIAARNALLPLNDPGVLTADVPSTTFVDPEVASVGLTEAQAIEKFGKDRIKVDIQYGSDRSACEGYESFDIITKVIFHARTQKILGATVMNPVAGETISELGVAMKANMKYPDLATVMHSYPSHAFHLQVMASEQYYTNLRKYKGILNILKGVGL